MAKTDDAPKKSAAEKAAKERSLQKQRKRTERTTRLLRPLVGAAILPKLNLVRTPKADIDGNFLLLCNHNTDFDFVVLGTRFSQTIYYVLSEHVMQKGTASKLLKYFFSPIARTKGTTASATVMQVIRTLRRGDSVCIFAEGNRSFNGVTCPILFSTGKLARASGVPLVTYRLIGGYFTSPRWSYTMRKGEMRGEVVNVYSPERLKAMTDDEVNEVICRDLYEDAYARQAQEHTAFKGKRLAEGLEHALYMCPECGKIGTMHSRGDKLSCACGMSVSYNEYGALVGGRFDSVTAWDVWQREELHRLIDGAAEEELFADDNARLYAIDDDHRRSVLLTGRLSMTRNALTVGDRVFPITGMSGLAIYGRCTMVFEHGGTHYEIDSADKLCSVKYAETFAYLTEN